MNELKKTGIFIVVALLLTGAAFLRVPDRTGRNAAFLEQGKPFFSAFKDPLACTDLEVIDYDASTATAARFKVMFKDGKWVIPSHYNYPADAKDRLAKTAAGVIGLNKDTIRSDRVDDWEAMGVIDPLDPKATSLKGRGKRVTLRDASEKILADFIIGNEVKDRPGQRYVRVPDQKPTYGVNVKVDLSTKFADWIETNLLKIDTARLRRVAFDGTKVDLDRGLVPGAVETIDRKDPAAPWTIEGNLPAGQEVNSEKLSALATALGDLKIVGVRPKPQGLTRDLRTNGDLKITLTQSAVLSLQNKGFFPTKDGRLLSNQGEVKVGTDEGVVYALRYGEVVFATGAELSAGIEEDAAAKAKAKEKEKDKGSESRYLMVTVSFDPALVPPPHSAGPETSTELPDDVFAPDPKDPKWVEEQKVAKEKAERETADHQRKLDEGQKRVEELMKRFAEWYYVTPGESFRSIALDRATLVRPKSAARPDAPAGMPAFPPGFPGVPGGHPNF